MPKLAPVEKARRDKAKLVYDLLMASPELGTYTRPFVRSWRQEHFPKEEFEFLLDTRTPEQISKHIIQFQRTNTKSWSGQIKQASTMVQQAYGIETNELRTVGGVFIVARQPDKDGKIVVLRRKEP